MQKIIAKFLMGFIVGFIVIFVAMIWFSISNVYLINTKWKYYDGNHTDCSDTYHLTKADYDTRGQAWKVSYHFWTHKRFLTVYPHFPNQAVSCVYIAKGQY